MNKNMNEFLDELLFANSLYGQYYRHTTSIYMPYTLLGHTTTMNTRERS